MDYNFSEKVETLLKKEGKTKKSLYDYLEMSMQGFDSMMKNNSFSAIRLAKIADFFGIPISYFYENQEKISKSASLDGGAFGEKILDEIRNLFKEELQQKNQQLQAKDKQLENRDKQIEGMQRTIDALVGKSNDVTADDRHDDPKIIVHPAFARKSEKEVYDYQIA